MDYALGLLVFWIALFAPIGLGVHWFVLGASARLQALPMTLLTGLSVAVVVLGSLRQLGIDLASTWIAAIFVALSVGIAIAVWRRKERWRSRELWGALVLLILVVVMIGKPMIERSGIEGLAGPIAYGTGFEPVEQVATIDATLQGDSASLEAVRSAGASSDERYTGFEQLAAFTVAAGGEIEPTKWSAYVLYSVLLGVVVALTSLPLFVLGRWRGMRWYGLLALALVGAVSPVAMVAMGFAHGPGAAATPFVVGAAVALLIARRDRGWYAVAAVQGSAAMVIAGPLILVPLIGVGIVWRVLQTSTHEHLAHTDVPVTRDRPLIATSLVLILAIHATIGALLAGNLLEWEALHATAWEAAFGTWPLIWIGSGLELDDPSSVLDWGLAATGPLLIALALARGLAQRETRELAMVVGAAFGVLCGLIIALGDTQRGIGLIEVSLLVTAPLLAAVCIRTVGRVREQARENHNARARYLVAGPLLALSLLLVSSVSTSGVSGSRIVHAPQLSPSPLPSGSALVAVADPWLAYELDGERARGDNVDADRMTIRGRYSQKSLLAGEYDYVVLDTNPMSSDPTGRYVENTLLDDYSVRLFADSRTPIAPSVQSGQPVSNASSRNTTKPAAKKDAPRTSSTLPIPRRHTPVESSDANGIGGVLVPAHPIKACTLSLDDSCDPRRPVREEDCTTRDLERLQAAETQGLNRAKNKVVKDYARDSKKSAEDERAINSHGAAASPSGSAGSSSAQAHDTDSDEPSVKVIDSALLGVACWSVPLDDETASLAIHVKDIGVVLSPRDAITSPRSAHIDERLDAQNGNPYLAGDRLTTSDADVEFSFGSGLLAQTYDVTVEGRFVAGMEMQASDSAGTPSSSVIRASAGHFSQIFREQSIFRNLRLINSSAADVSVGRVFVRPTDLARSCDLVVGVSGKGAGSADIKPLYSTTSDASGSTLVGPGFGAAVSAVETLPARAGVVPRKRLRLVFGNHMQHRGAPRVMMLDWVEQYSTSPSKLGKNTCAFDSEAVSDQLPGQEATANDASSSEGATSSTGNAPTQPKSGTGDTNSSSRDGSSRG